jgi:hypothetical protein
LTNGTKQEHYPRPTKGTHDMTLVLTAFIMIAFAAIYAVLLAMIGKHARVLGSALFGTPDQPRGTAALAASRRFSRA